eukprot:10254094-Alexandrium_andersonii.AAC.1
MAGCFFISSTRTLRFSKSKSSPLTRNTSEMRAQSRWVNRMATYTHVEAFCSRCASHCAQRSPGKPLALRFGAFHAGRGAAARFPIAQSVPVPQGLRTGSGR